MKTIEELAEEYCVKNIPNLKDMHLTISTAFEAGFEKSQEWISVDDELPKDGQYCLIRTSYWNGRNVEYALYSKSFYDSELKFLLLSRDVYVEQGSITHWRPIDRR